MGSSLTEGSSLDAHDCWQAIIRRDRMAGVRFVYAVRTTGVYCRPSCGARLPRPENVSYYACHRAIRRNGDLAGYRWGLACKQELLERERQDSGVGSRANAENNPALEVGSWISNCG
ncbi:MAG: MGMT family protein [Burkholderiales bacterium]|nr:MGMT family protein [Burkholderiales bacterium]